MNNKKRVSSKSFFILAALSFAIIIGLGFFRISVSQLEFSLINIEKDIKRYDEEEKQLEQI